MVKGLNPVLRVINDNITLQSLQNNASELKKYIDDYNEIHIKTYNGAWTSRIVLPKLAKDSNNSKKVTVEVNSDWGVIVYDGKKSFAVNKGQKLLWTYQSSSWEVFGLKTKLRIIDDNTTLNSLKNSADELIKYIKDYDEVRLKTRNGAWTSNIILPKKGSLHLKEDKKFSIEVNSVLGVKVDDGIQVHNLKKGDKAS